MSTSDLEKKKSSNSNSPSPSTSAKPSSMGVAIVGCGTVGNASARLLLSQSKSFLEKAGVNLELKYLVAVNFSRATAMGLPSKLFSEDISIALQDPAVQIIVETVGGITIARKIIERALKAGKHVVTANKALLAHHGASLFKLARDNSVSIGFEASCAGGIPVIRNLVDGLLANTNEALYGIINGTSNFILTQMVEEGKTYHEALSQAQKDGLAEADPSLDVNGMDAAHKLCLLSTLAFGKHVNLNSIPVEGIESIDYLDVETGNRLGYVIKLLAQAKETPHGLELSVRPNFLPGNHPLARVSGAFNALSVYGNAVGHTMYYGRGAGGSPTSSAIMSDLLSIALGTWPKLFSTLKLWPHNTPEAKLADNQNTINRHYLRFTIKNESGIIARISSELAKNGISINSLLQNESHAMPQVPLAITTHPVKDQNVHNAFEAIQKLSIVSSSPKSVWIRIISEHEESDAAR